jgi:diacylglycerol kinase family enzyme
VPTLVVVNPHATGVDRARRDCLLDTLRGVTRTETVETTGRGHAVALARDAMRRREVEVVVALGGDGTVNEVANGLLADGIHDYIPAMGVVPGGATNVFCRSLGLPRDFRAATDALRCHLRTAQYRTIGVGSVDERTWKGNVHGGTGRASRAPQARRHAISSYVPPPAFACNGRVSHRATAYGG